MMDINWNSIDAKWQNKWAENNDHDVDPNEKEKNS